MRGKRMFLEVKYFQKIIHDEEKLFADNGFYKIIESPYLIRINSEFPGGGEKNNGNSRIVMPDFFCRIYAVQQRHNHI